MELITRTRGDARERGFTILEIVISLGILAFGLLAVAAMQLHALKGGSQARHTTQAMAVAQDRMEAFMRTDFTGMAPTAGWAAPQTISQQIEAGTGTQTEQVYTVAWRINDDVVSWTKTVDVRVQWNEPDRPNRQVVITSRRYNW